MLPASSGFCLTVPLTAQAKRHAILNDGDISKSEAATKAVLKLASELETEGCKQGASLIRAISINKNQLSIALDPEAVAGATNLSASSLQDSLCKISISIACKRRGVETRILAGERRADPDQTLIRALRNAHNWANALQAGEPIRQLARRVGNSEGYMRRVITLVSLSPRIQNAIIDGTQPAELNLETLVRGTIPLDWNHQDRLFGLNF